MDDIQAIIQLDFKTVFLGIFVILFGWQAIQKLLDYIRDRYGIETKKMREKREDHELLVQTAQNLAVLTEKSEKDDRGLEDALTSFINEVRISFDCVNRRFEDSNRNQLQRKEQSLEIQRELTNSIKSIVEKNTIRDAQIDSLMLAQREVLANKINERYKHYISINGIPEDELDEFINLHTAYKLCGGNSSGDAKFEYCIDHLPVLPVETKLVIKHDER